MSKRSSRILLAAVLAASFAVGCNKQTSPAANPATASASGGQCELAPDAVVGTYKVDGAEQKVTYGELTGRIGAPLADLDKRKQDLLKRGLDGYIIEKLVQAEAKKRGLPNEDALLKAEVEDKSAQPSDAEIQKIYDQAKAAGQLPAEVTLEQVKPEIVKMLGEQGKREKAQALFNDLKSKADVKVLLPEKRIQVEATGPAKGPDNAPITIVEFSDFQCPFCSRAKVTVDEVVKQYGDKVRLVFRHFPLSFHQDAPKAAEAAACADDQKKFWEYHDKLFANQGALKVDDLKKHAADLGLDTARFNECLDSGKKAELVKKDMSAGEKAGVSGTPAFFINGVVLSGAVPAEEFKSIIDAELSKKK
ncbi:DsbA family protein [Hyalangium minutum]|uniref:Periplasmic thiol:disulfide interchange protein DsbA n=1 Tax=Hyalangium minutum TaxID=394096 RepID=A0A085WHL5_9BACT|nr:thioredoxin domain-containing protein [Hyalangium minutum]KFE67178.1 Periplasmic thiol:disulfide interchange protein DsbA [Hyalangium minutum]